ncbi:MAG: putative membrane-bound dolichyl-phosphate-mannose-protein mannosyltransferase [Myxococcota bacterium]
MLRWIAVGFLVLAAGLTTWAALRTTAPRGLVVRSFDNTRWTGESTGEEVWRHVDFGPDQNRNRYQPPDKTSLRMDGWIFAPRTGDYVLDMKSRDDALLFIDDELIVRHTKRRQSSDGPVRLTKGFHPIRIQIAHVAGVSDFWLRWKMPGHYMDREALQPIFLHPTDPSAAQSPPLALKLAPILLILFAFIVATLPWLSGLALRVARDPTLRRHVATGALIATAALGVRTIDIDDGGETSDEWAYSIAGRIYVSNIAHGYYQSIYWRSNQEHPPLGKFVYGAVSHLSGTDSLPPLRLASAALGALTILLIYAFAVRLLSGFVAITASTVLIGLPTFVAHTRVATLESPSVFMFTLAAVMFFFAQTHVEGRNRRFLIASIVGCLAFATKFSSGLVFVLMVAAYLAREWQTIRKTGSIQLPIALYILPALPMLVLLAVWPWLWREPFGQLIATLEHWNYPVTEWFLGSLQTPPWFYYPVYFLLTTPALLLIAFALFWIRLVTKRRYWHLVVALWFLVPFIWGFSSLKQDGVRYLAPMFPALALTVGLGVEHVVKRLNWQPVAVFATGLYLVWQSFIIHPFYLDYYSELFGGTRGVYAARLGQTGWWGEGLDQAIAHVNAAAPPGATWETNAQLTHPFGALRPDLIERSGSPDIYIDTELSPASEFRPGYLPHFWLEADGAPIVIVFVKQEVMPTLMVAPFPPG